MGALVAVEGQLGIFRPGESGIELFIARPVQAVKGRGNSTLGCHIPTEFMVTSGHQDSPRASAWAQAPPRSPSEKADWLIQFPLGPRKQGL